MDKYIRIEKIGEGTYGVVYKGKNKRTGELVAIKKVRLEAEDEGIPSTTIRETSLLVELKHTNIVRMLEVQLDESRIYLIFEFLSMDLKKYLDCLPEGEMLDSKLVQSYMYQMSNAVLFCHMRRIMHRDLKPQNILINSNGVLKVADFGLGRAYGVPVRAYTHEIVTLWYRAPEVLLGTTRYLCPVDIWSIGCIFAEMTTRKPLFQGDSEIDQLYRIFRILRTPNDNLWIGVSQLQDYKSTFPKWTEYKLPEHVSNMSATGIDLLEKTLIYDPSLRIMAREILEHPYFNNIDLTVKPNIK